MRGRWRPETLKLGIDLSGGTILVYEVEQENLPAGFKMDDLIAALKQRVNPEGVYDIPIRKIGGNRVEIILPKDSGEAGRGGQAGADRRRLPGVPHPGQPASTDAAGDRAAPRAPTAWPSPPAGYKWAKLGEIATGTNPKFDAESLTDPPSSGPRTATRAPRSS